jgi:hypothetical protein
MVNVALTFMVNSPFRDIVDVLLSRPFNLLRPLSGVLERGGLQPPRFPFPTRRIARISAD